VIPLNSYHVLVIQYLLFIGLTIGVYEAKKLRTNWHHFWVYTVYFIQLGFVLFWMLPSFLFVVERNFFGNTTFQILIITHATIGTITGLIATYLVFSYLLKPDFNIPRLKQTRPLMKAVYYLWLFNLLLGTFIILS
jgi:hypothetical protein